MDIHERYNYNKEQKNGTECICPICSDTFIKKSKPHCFCNDPKKEVKCSSAFSSIRNFFRRHVPEDILRKRGYL
jgi:hypothetical protein